MANKGGGDLELTPHPNVARRLLKNEQYLKEQIRMSNGEDRYDAVNHLIGLPGLDLRQVGLVRMVLRYLKELKSIVLIIFIIMNSVK